MRILIIGGDGMLGHQLLQTLQQTHEVIVTLRQDASIYEPYKLFNATNARFNVAVTDMTHLQNLLNDIKPDAVINAVGIVKQRATAKEAIPSIEINALFPHRLAMICEAINAKLIQISTDCVFSGNQGYYREDCTPDPKDLYGHTKLLGELHYSHTLTLRTSIIGLELSRKMGLIEWFLASRGPIKGFRRAIYSGLTTMELSRVINTLLLKHPELHGIWHVASEPINKYDLLCQLSSHLKREDMSIAADDQFVCDRSLCADNFNEKIGYVPPGWEQMLEELTHQIHDQKRLVCFSQEKP